MASSPSEAPPTRTMDTVSKPDMAVSPRATPQKGVTIFDEPEHIEPVKLGECCVDGTSPTLVASTSPKLHRASISGKKMTGRPALSQNASSTSLAQQMSFLSLENSGPECDTPAESKTPDLRSLLSQVVEWLHEEKAKRHRRRHAVKNSLHPRHHHRQRSGEETPEGTSTPRMHDYSEDHDVDLSLDKLEDILAGFTASYIQSLSKLTHKSSTSLLRRGSIAKKFTKRGSVAPQSSDTEFFGDDILVPSVEAALDNSRTMAFTCSSAEADTSDMAKQRDMEHWLTFKREIVRLTHTLKLKGWRRIPMESATDIEVSRLSGALTNAVYVVSPPENVAEEAQPGSQTPGTQGDSSVQQVMKPKHRPAQLLLRIYGPQVEHLIDRKAELAILRRLARKRIGPRLLGCFENGRFEEYLHATTLTAEDIRVPETSKQIAKRMRELHEGIDLLESELKAGPAVFKNWDKWVDRVEKVICFLDDQVRLAAEEQEQGEQAGHVPKAKFNPRYTRRGLICGVEWPVFRRAYEAYRERLVKDYGGPEGIRASLIFAHNDTQYGNLMRLQPSGTSPLLQPSNQHKQLVVIDFEYASQNTIGLEFANHFTEWCYNYHHPELSACCDTKRYPDEKEQYRFVRSYVMHRPQFNPSASATPKMDGREKTNITDFMLDARAPPKSSSSSTALEPLPSAALDYDVQEQEREKAQEAEIQRLLRETRLWRTANSAMWVAWGIVQAKVPELEKKERRKPSRIAKDIVEGVVGKVKGFAAGSPAAEKDASSEGNGEEQVPTTTKALCDPPSTEEESTEHKSEEEPSDGQKQDEAHDKGDSTTSAVAKDTNDQAGDDSNEADGDEEEEEYDYLGYAQDRAMFFWGDCIQMGIVKEDELPSSLRERVKIVPY